MTNSRVLASPLAKKIAKEKNIDINLVNGSGDNGRIIKEDVENFKPTATILLKQYRFKNILNQESKVLRK